MGRFSKNRPVLYPLSYYDAFSMLTCHGGSPLTKLAGHNHLDDSGR